MRANNCAHTCLHVCGRASEGCVLRERDNFKVEPTYAEISKPVFLHWLTRDVFSARPSQTSGVVSIEFPVGVELILSTEGAGEIMMCFETIFHAASAASDHLRRHTLQQLDLRRLRHSWSSVNSSQIHSVDSFLDAPGGTTRDRVVDCSPFFLFDNHKTVPNFGEVNWLPIASTRSQNHQHLACTRGTTNLYISIRLNILNLLPNA